MTTSTTLQEQSRLLAEQDPAAVSLSDALAMRIGLALLIWGRRHAAERSVRPAALSAPLIGDARWYMR